VRRQELRRGAGYLLSWAECQCHRFKRCASSSAAGTGAAIRDGNDQRIAQPVVPSGRDIGSDPWTAGYVASTLALLTGTVGLTCVAKSVASTLGAWWPSSYEWRQDQPHCQQADDHADGREISAHRSYTR
jgi:hypothetical protein